MIREDFGLKHSKQNCISFAVWLTFAIAAAAAKKAEADKAAILAAVEASGKSVEEILEFLK